MGDGSVGGTCDEAACADWQNGKGACDGASAHCALRTGHGAARHSRQGWVGSEAEEQP